MVVKSHTSGMVDIVTYRYNGELVYVPVAPNYLEALAYARQAFPQLRDSALSLSMTSGQVEGFVGISELAWPKLIQHMLRYQVIDVHVTQAHERGEPLPVPMTTTYADAEGRERSEPLPTLRSGKRNWFFRKLRTTAKKEYGDGRNTMLSTVPQRSASYPVSTTSACFSYDCRVYAENPSQASSLVV
ncbi:hypothetical protein J3R83DRAFT_14036 [Lanmaoa asiatica]|nr:hypothetical protein J3R83DRAFT_14036 [Lanmaoa asiatica]